MAFPIYQTINDQHCRITKPELNTILTDGECTLSLNLEEKKAVVAEISAQVAKAQAIIIAEYRGLGVGHMTQLRAKARQSGIYFRVLKNSLARRAINGYAISADFPITW